MKISSVWAVHTDISRAEDLVDGLNFTTPNDLFIRVGSWYYPKGKKLPSHVLKTFPRTATRTQEMTYVKRGSMRVPLYNDDKTFCRTTFLRRAIPPSLPLVDRAMKYSKMEPRYWKPRTACSPMLSRTRRNSPECTISSLLNG